MSIISSKDFTLYFGNKIGVERITMDVTANTVTAIIVRGRIARKLRGG